MPKPESDQFKTIYHFSDSPEPPHLGEHPVFGGPKGLNNPRPDREGSNEVIFGTEEKNLRPLFRRNWMHIYKVPESAISPEIFGDDDAGTRVSKIETPDWQKRPQLWQQVPASRLDALKRGIVTRFTNTYEFVSSDEGGVYHTLSYILPKPHFEKLGIEYQGVERSPYEDIVKPKKMVEDRIRKSYGPGIR